MNAELVTYRHKVKIGWLIAATIMCVIVFTLGIFVSPFINMSDVAHAFSFMLPLIFGGGFAAACIIDIFKRIKDIEICWKNNNVG